MEQLKFVSQKVFRLIEESKHTILVTHQKPDGDGLGALTAMIGHLNDRRHEYTAFCLDDVPEHFTFLPHSYKVTKDQEIFRQSMADLLIFFDCPDMRYAGVAEHVDSLKSDFSVINIDHHHDNEHYGDINIVDGTAPSATTLLYHLFLHQAIHINKEIATCLLCGLLTDTSNFTNPATTGEALAIGADLIRRGARFREIVRSVWQNKDVLSLKIWGLALARLKFNKTWGIASTFLKFDDLSQENIDIERATDGVANFLSTLGESKAILFLREETEGRLKGSLRTTRGDIDTSRLARLLGGGGHKKASAFALPGQIHKLNGQIEII